MNNCGNVLYTVFCVSAAVIVDRAHGNERSNFEESVCAFIREM